MVFGTPMYNIVNTNIHNCIAPMKRSKPGDDRLPSASAPPKRRSPTTPLVNMDVLAGDGLHPEQLAAIAKLNQIPRRHQFITGSAGCGKSMTIRSLIKGMEAAGTVYAVTASTGIAACPINGTTLHRFLSLRRETQEELLDPKEALRRCMFGLNAARLCTAEVIIVDEISMVSAELMHAFIFLLRTVRMHYMSTPDGPTTDLPVIVMFGDFLQLKPVQGEWALFSEAWKSIRPVTTLLRCCFRQADDDDFYAMLCEVRKGKCNRALLEKLNSRVGAKLPGEEHNIKPTELYATNKDVDAINEAMLAKLPGPFYTFPAEVYLGRESSEDGWVPVAGCKVCTIGAEHRAKSLDVLQRVKVLLPDRDTSREHTADLHAAATHVETMERYAQAKSYAVGAQVMFTTNVSVPRVANGTRGVIVAFRRPFKDAKKADPRLRVEEGDPGVEGKGADDDDDGELYPLVRLADGGVFLAQPFTITEKRPDTDTTPRMVLRFVPLTLAWALTAHKSQGMTLDLLKVNPEVKTAGQLYVMLSRAHKLSCVTLGKPIQPHQIYADRDVVNAYEELERAFPA